MDYEEENKSFSQIDWRFLKYYRAVGYLANVDKNRNEVVVFLPQKNLTFIADISSYVNPDKLKAGKAYDMTFAIYQAKANKNMARIIAEKIKEPLYSFESKYTREYFGYGLEDFEQTLLKLDTFYRFELLRASDRSYLPEMQAFVRQQFENSVESAYNVPTKFKWRHLLGY